MKKVLKLLKNNLLGLVLGLMIGGVSIAVADNLISSRLISFDKDKLKINKGIDTNAETVEEALNELYEKASHVGQCPSGYSCNKIANPYLPENDTNTYVQSEFVENLKVGDFVKMIPTKSSVRLDGLKTGYRLYIATPMYINPQELQYWRVIRKNTNGTVDVISEYVSSSDVYFNGMVGYANYIGYLNELASYYENSKYTIGSRYMGYSGQTKYIIDISKFNGSITSAPWYSSTTSSTTVANEALGAGDMGYQIDYNLVKEIYGNESDSVKAYKVNTSTYANYWLGSRYYYCYNDSSDFRFRGRLVNNEGKMLAYDIRRYIRGWADLDNEFALRPILTLKADITTNIGDGSKDNPYVLG